MKPVVHFEDLVRDVSVALTLYMDTTMGQMATAALDAIPDGWAKLGGEWVQAERCDVCGHGHFIVKETR